MAAFVVLKRWKRPGESVDVAVRVSDVIDVQELKGAGSLLHRKEGPALTLSQGVDDVVALLNEAAKEGEDG